MAPGFTSTVRGQNFVAADATRFCARFRGPAVFEASASGVEGPRAWWIIPRIVKNPAKVSGLSQNPTYNILELGICYLLMIHQGGECFGRVNSGESSPGKCEQELNLETDLEDE